MFVVADVYFTLFNYARLLINRLLTEYCSSPDLNILCLKDNFMAIIKLVLLKNRGKILDMILIY